MSLQTYSSAFATWLVHRLEAGTGRPPTDACRRTFYDLANEQTQRVFGVFPCNDTVLATNVIGMKLARFPTLALLHDERDRLSRVDGEDVEEPS